MTVRAAEETVRAVGPAQIERARRRRIRRVARRISLSAEAAREAAALATREHEEEQAESDAAHGSKLTRTPSRSGRNVPEDAGIPRAGAFIVLPLRPSLAAWNGAPLGGSAKSLGLVRSDGEGTATVTRQHDGSKADWSDGSDTLDRKQPVDEPQDDGDESDDGPATVLKGRKIDMPPATAHASSDDDDLNETARADDDNLDTPVGAKKVLPPTVATPAVGGSASTPIKTPMAMAVPAAPSPSSPPPSAPTSNAPESGQTRIAPIVAPPPTVAATPVGQMTQPMTQQGNTPPHAWVAPTIPSAAPPSGLTSLNLSGLAAKARALPPHKLALVVSMTLMAAALMFVFVRSRTPAPVAGTFDSQFPPPVEVLPPPAPQAPQVPVVLPPPAPTWNSQAQAQPHPPVATKPTPAPPARRAPARATSRTTIPMHREE